MREKYENSCERAFKNIGSLAFIEMRHLIPDPSVYVGLPDTELCTSVNYQAPEFLAITNLSSIPSTPLPLHSLSLPHPQWNPGL